VNASESLPDLPSTVPDSQAIANVDQTLQEIPDASVEQVMTALRKMSSQGGPHDTQPLTPDYIDTLLKSRQSQRREQDTGYTHGSTGNTHGSLQPGDRGHVDFSSYVQAEITIDLEEESEPIEVDFSPTQPIDNRLSQFPESQRFKTPATMGKKRNYNGDVVESPALPRNPLARAGQPTPGRMMGLSQAFAATQAPSSPFVNGIPSELHSDRPSPAFPIQMRPMTATDSSPMLARPTAPRRSTEPQTKYISMAESQAMRDAQKRKELDELEEENSDSSFDETPSSIVRRRQKRWRDEKAQMEFDAVAKTNTARASKSSPIQSSRVRRRSSLEISPLNGYLHPDTTSPPDLPEEITNASEAETDQEDESHLAARHSSQMRLRTVPEEDKENAPQGAVQIPETVALHRIMSGHAAEVEASPSVRYSVEGVISHPSSQRQVNGEPFIVANSQPSQVRRYIINGPKLASSGEQTDFVPQSQYPAGNGLRGSDQLGDLAEENIQSPPQQDMSHKPDLLVSKSDIRSRTAETAEDTRPVTEQRSGNQDEEEADQDEEPPRRTLRSQPAHQTLSSTIPETSSARLGGGVSSSTDQRGEMSKSMSDFETAPTHPLASSNNHDSAPAALPSQAPVLVGPARNKRKRMTDIDAEESQPQSTGPDFAELSPMLKDHEYRDIMGSSSPIRLRRAVKKRRLEDSPLKPRQAENNLLVVPSITEVQIDPAGKESPDEQEPRTTQGETPPASSDEIQAAVPKRRGLHRPNHQGNGVKHAATYGRTRSKPSAWDIQGSPEESAVTRSASRATSLRQPSSTLQSTKLHPASASVLSRAASQHPRINNKHDISPIVAASRQSRAKGRLQNPDVSIGLPEATSETVPTPVVPSDDRSAPPGAIVAPNQVLACFNGKARAYYPAACLGVSGAETLRYQIQWDGYERDEIDESGLRSLDLRHGDIIKINLEGFPKTAHVIRGFKEKANKGENAVIDVRGYKKLLVAQKQRKSLPINGIIAAEEIKEVPVSSIYLDSNMWNQMKDRRFTYVPPINLPSSARAGFSTPMDRPSTPSTPSSRSRRIAASAGLPTTGPLVPATGSFANMSFAISYDNPTRKNELTSLITANGGLVLNSGFQELFQQDTMALKPHYVTLGFTALLADKHSRKEKYLQALSLGLPCLSGKWLEACIASDTLVDWQSYLLPAGESDELEGAIRSRVLPLYDPVSSRATDMVSGRPDVLNTDAVIFVLGRGKAEEKRRPYVFLTQALGAGHIEKVSDVRAAKAHLDGPDGKSYKWVFVDDRDVETANTSLTKKPGRGVANDAGVRVVGNEFVKQSLVLGRMFGG
jgi:hypothetical protein